MDAGPLLEYFEPLMNWLEAENDKNEVEVGWDHATKGKKSYFQPENNNKFFLITVCKTIKQSSKKDKMNNWFKFLKAAKF